MTDVTHVRVGKQPRAWPCTAPTDRPLSRVNRVGTYARPPPLPRNFAMHPNGGYKCSTVAHPYFAESQYGTVYNNNMCALDGLWDILRDIRIKWKLYYYYSKTVRAALPFWTTRHETRGSLILWLLLLEFLRDSQDAWNIMQFSVFVFEWIQ